jgi:hypothetical protein
MELNLIADIVKHNNDPCTTRTVWVHEIKYHNFFIDNCAICRELLISACLDCQINVPPPDRIYREQIEEKKRNIVNELQRMWMIILLMHKRKESIFYLLDKPLVSKMYSYVGKDIIYKTMNAFKERATDGCKVVKLKCAHIYHEHCFLKWLAKRMVCPLCNGNDTSYIYTYNTYSTPLSNVFNLNAYSPFVTQSEMNEHQSIATTFLYRRLKHTHGGITGSDLYQQYQGFFERTLNKIAPIQKNQINQERRMKIFRNTINELIEREFIRYDTVTNSYHHIP